MGMTFSFPIVGCDAISRGLEALLILGRNFRSTRRFIGFNGLTGSDMDLPPEPGKFRSPHDLQIRKPGHLRKRSLDSILIQPDSPKHEAAVKLQKVYKSFRTRRQLADCAVLVEQRWWKLLDFALLRRSSVSFFDIDKQESAVSRWSRAKSRAAKVGKGLSKDEKARKLALQHWLEAIDPRHRYGHNLKFYYDCWLQSESMQPFFYWLDVGEGKEVNLEQQCARSKLQQQCIKYLGPKEREAYEVIIDDRKFVYEQSRQVLDTRDGPKGVKWIFVLSTSKKLYVAQKKKGTFQHSSFLAGGATSAAGQLVVENGVLKAVWPHSGHYRPTEKNFQEFMSFLEENNVDLTEVKKSPAEEDGELCIRLSRSELNLAELNVDFGEQTSSNAAAEASPDDTKFGGEEKPGASLGDHTKESEEEMDESKLSVKETNRDSSCTEDEQTPIPSEFNFRRINSKRVIRSYQLGKKLSCKWTTGAGPRIGCVRDYPSELQFRAMEEVNLSPRSPSRLRGPTSRRVKGQGGQAEDKPSGGKYNPAMGPSFQRRGKKSVWSGGCPLGREYTAEQSIRSAKARQGAKVGLLVRLAEAELQRVKVELPVRSDMT